MIILEDLNFVWEREETDQVIAMWKDGSNVIYIAEKVNRPTEEVFLLLMHLGRQNRIRKRAGYFWGRKQA